MNLDYSEFGQQMPLPEAFLEGAKAHREGVPFSLNPYNRYTQSEDRDSWDNGWQEAEYAAEYWNDATNS